MNLPPRQLSRFPGQSNSWQKWVVRLSFRRGGFRVSRLRSEYILWALLKMMMFIYPSGKKKHILVINGMFEDDFPFGNRWDMFVSWRVSIFHTDFLDEG